jgi:hypothetical protein
MVLNRFPILIVPLLTPNLNLRRSTLAGQSARPGMYWMRGASIPIWILFYPKIGLHLFLCKLFFGDTRDTPHLRISTFPLLLFPEQLTLAQFFFIIFNNLLKCIPIDFTKFVKTAIFRTNLQALFFKG